ncbi:MAG: hypothetical protein HYT72_02335 [Candidatus Aenigmarchaeota archaeon]|nr:hypothetical protein [Candidatus Aenigmarchaeota archaeon]
MQEKLMEFFCTEEPEVLRVALDYTRRPKVFGASKDLKSFAWAKLRGEIWQKKYS